LGGSYLEEPVLSENVWKKPVICIFKERSGDHWESDPFVVIKAKHVTVIAGNNPKFSGVIEDFFTLMGDAEYISSPEGKADHYVMCWFDDTEPDMTKDLRRLRGVRFNGEVTHSENPKTHKRTYNGTFTAEQAKIT
jgi:hypothetical protein